MADGARKVLILGGYGVFGGRIAHLLVQESRLELIIAGRSLEKAEAFCSALPASAQRRAALFDRDGDVAAQLAALAPDLVIDASGPFQIYDGDPWRLARATIAQGADYMDLADGSAFVDGIAALDPDAKARGVYVLSGVSSFPVLTAAVTRRLSVGMTRLDHVTAGIAPSPYAGVGLNVIRAVASYAGQTVRVRRDGRDATGDGLIDVKRRTIAPPGFLPLANTRFSLVDTPDLIALPKLWPQLRSVWVGAGPVPEILHRMLRAMAQLVRWRIVPSLEPLSPLFHWAINRVRWGEHRGGMFVDVDGADAHGAPIRRSWHMLAEGDDGPFIPSMAIEAIVRRDLAGRRPAAGARAATNDLELEDYDALFARRAIRHGVREETAGTRRLSLYRRILGSAYDALPATVRAMHENGVNEARGIAEVTRGSNPLARLAGFLFSFPRAGADIPINVRFARGDGVEVWTRDFGGATFSSRQSIGKGRNDALLVERFGPFSFSLALVVEGERLRLVTRRWSMFGVPLPLALSPRSDAFEEERDGRFRFHVEIALPLAGLVVRYRGWLEPAAERK